MNLDKDKINKIYKDRFPIPPKPTDTSRIPLMLDLLEQHWIDHPNWRFGQLVSNILNSNNGDIFYISDLESMKLLENYGEMGNE